MKQKRDRLNDESRLSRFTTHVVLIFASFLAFGPFVWMFLTSIKTYEETIQIPMKFLPEIPQWVNYSIVSDKLNFPQLYLNTILVTIMMIVGQILIVTICAYAFDRLNFPGKNVLFMLVMATMMVPGEATIISNYLTVSSLGILDTYLVLILPSLTSAMGIFLFRQFYMTFPMSLYESAKLDGCGSFREFWNIIFPNIWSTYVVFTVATLATYFGNNLNLYSFYGPNADTKLYTFGYWLFRETELNKATMDNYPFLSAVGVCFTMILVPIVMLIRKCMLKFGPRPD